VIDMPDALLPDQFAGLEPYARKWCWPTEDQRWAERLASSMNEIQSFYDAFEPRAEEAMKYCDQFTVDNLPEDARNLLYLLCALVQASFPVECWGQVRVPDTGAAHVSCIVQPLL
jgi:hypothetical protein